MNTGLTEGTPEQSKFHLACVDGSHGRVAETTNTKRGFQLHLSPCLGPQPAEKKESAVNHHHHFPYYIGDCSVSPLSLKGVAI